VHGAQICAMCIVNATVNSFLKSYRSTFPASFFDGINIAYQLDVVGSKPQLNSSKTTS